MMMETAEPEYVLVVEDQKTQRIVLTEMLRGIDPSLRVEAFSVPSDALKWAATHKAEMVVTDLQMPGMDGIVLMEKLHALPRYEHVPILVVTVYDEKDHRYRALNAGAIDFLVKPFDPVECSARCRNLLALGRQHSLLQRHTEKLEAKLRRADNLLKAIGHNGVDSHPDIVPVDYQTLFDLTSAVTAAEILLNETQSAMERIAAQIKRPLHG